MGGGCVVLYYYYYYCIRYLPLRVLEKKNEITIRPNREINERRLHAVLEVAATQQHVSQFVAATEIISERRRYVVTITVIVSYFVEYLYFENCNEMRHNSQTQLVRIVCMATLRYIVCLHSSILYRQLKRYYNTYEFVSAVESLHVTCRIMRIKYIIQYLYHGRSTVSYS